MISPNSSSYPIAAAALATGVSYAHAYGYVWANRLYLDDRNAKAGQDGLVAAWEALVDEYGEATTAAFQERVEAAIMDGRVYWPYPDFFAARALQAERRLLVIEEDDDAGDPPEQPEAVV